MLFVEVVLVGGSVATCQREEDGKELLRSLAQWSRASESVLSKRRGPNIGRRRIR